MKLSTLLSAWLALALASCSAPYHADLYVLASKSVAYSVSYDGNGNDGGAVPVDGQRYKSGATVAVAGNPNGLTKAGEDFSGWNAARDGSGTTYTQGQSLSMASADLSLYALWTVATPSYSVTYDANGGAGSPPTDGSAYKYGQTVTVQAGPGALSILNGVFGGWNTASDGSGATYDGSGLATIAMGSANLSLYAMWLTVSGSVLTAVPPNAKNVIIPSGITSIATAAFQNDVNLVSVSIPATVASIGIQAFEGCPNLASFTSASAAYPVLNGGLVQASDHTLEAVPAKYSGVFTVDSSIHNIQSYAFDRCSLLMSVVIPATMASFGDYNAFSGVTSSNFTITIPPTITSLLSYSFWSSSVTDVYMQSLTPPSLGLNVFDASAVIHVQDAATKSAYIAVAGWLAIQGQITYP